VLLGVFTALLFVEEGRCTLTEVWRSASRLKMLLGGVAMITVSFCAYWLQRLLGRCCTCALVVLISLLFTVSAHMCRVVKMVVFTSEAGHRIFLRNIGISLKVHMILQLRRPTVNHVECA
jgi:hypothetical protein